MPLRRTTVPMNFPTIPGRARLTLVLGSALAPVLILCMHVVALPLIVGVYWSTTVPIAPSLRPCRQASSSPLSVWTLPLVALNCVNCPLTVGLGPSRFRYRPVGPQLTPLGP